MTRNPSRVRAIEVLGLHLARKKSVRSLPPKRKKFLRGAFAQKQAASMRENRYFHTPERLPHSTTKKAELVCLNYCTATGVGCDAAETN